MNVINAATFPTTNLSIELESRKDYRISSTVVKRQIRRQARRRLATELRAEVAQLHLDAAELTVARRSVSRMMADIASQIDGSANGTPRRTKTAPRQVMVTRKLAGSPFERKQVRTQVVFA